MVVADCWGPQICWGSSQFFSLTLLLPVLPSYRIVPLLASDSSSLGLLLSSFWCTFLKLFQAWYFTFVRVLSSGFHKIRGGECSQNTLLREFSSSAVSTYGVTKTSTSPIIQRFFYFLIWNPNISSSSQKTTVYRILKWK